jgi:transposase-like protein
MPSINLPRKLADDCLQELRWIYDRRELVEVRRDMAAWLSRWQAKHPKPCDWVEENIEETIIYYRLPLQNHRHMKSTNMLKRRNGASIEQRNWLLGGVLPGHGSRQVFLDRTAAHPELACNRPRVCPTP